LKFVDPSPPSFPSNEEQTDALQKGLGRAMHWAVAGRLDETPLLEACLHDLRHDIQVEDSRGEWLWQLIQAVNSSERFSGPLLDNLRRFPDDRSVYQLCELAYFYAATGSEDFRQRLYEIVEQKPFIDAPRLGEDEILRLDGEKGFLFAAKVRGNLLIDRGWEWNDDSLIHDAVEQLGETQTVTLLQSTTDKSVKRFHDCWVNEKKRQTERSQQSNRKQEMQAIGVDDIIAEVEKERPAIALFRRWGMHAIDDDLNKILEAMWSTKRPKAVVNFLRIFSNRPLPSFDPRLIEFCNHTDEEVRRWAFKSMENNSHPLIREFAITNLQQGVRDGRFVGLLIRNYAKSDETLILGAMELPNDLNELHWLLGDVIKVLENNSDADPSKLALVAYVHTPCEICRFDAARLLNSSKVAPDWMPAECRNDSSERCRELFLDTTKPTTLDLFPSQRHRTLP
jgi:hypothetical protein